jgi:hypothetical protein
MTDQTDTSDQARPLTYDDAESVYQTSLTAARDRHAELSDRDLCAGTVAKLRERGEFDPENLGHRGLAEREPLTVAERLEHMAIGEILARYYRHPSMLDHAAKAGANWEQIGAARGIGADQARLDYRKWAEGQHNLLSWTDGRFGMSDAEYAAALERSGLTEAERSQRQAVEAARGGVAHHAEMVRQADAAGIPLLDDPQPGTAKAGTGEETAQCLVTFDLTADRDTDFALTEALREFAARQRWEAEDEADGNAGSRIRWAEAAEAALARIENPPSPEAGLPDGPARYGPPATCGEFGNEHPHADDAVSVPAPAPSGGAAKAYAAEHPVLCAHADQGGAGSHWLEPGEKCASLGQATAPPDLEAGQ